MVSLLRPFRRSLLARVFTLTAIVATLVIYLLGSNLESRIENGIIDEKISSSISEANSLIQFATYKLTIGTLTAQAELPKYVDEIVNSTDVGAQESGREIVLINYEGKVVQGIPSVLASNSFMSTSVVADLRNKVRGSVNTEWKRGVLQYLDGTSTEGILIGRRIAVPKIGTYELYVAYSFKSQFATIDLIRSAIVVTGAIMVILILLMSLIVLRRVIKPVQAAAEIAERLTSGELNKRMEVKGEDEIARLGTAFNEMATTLSNQIARLENLSRIQQRFVSDVSHELRTPLTTIRMAADVLHSSRSEFDPAVARSAELLTAQIERFEALLSDLLEVSRFDAKVATANLAKVDIVAITRRCVEDLSHLAVERNSPIRLITSEDQVVIDGDQLRLERILRNLLTNAIDHGEGKAIEVKILSNDSDISIGVRDYGIGLSQQQIARVFDRFWRADPSRSRIRGGTGLGLSIAQEDAALHGGKIEVWGEVGVGSHFVLTLPRNYGSKLTSTPIPALPTR